MANHRRDKSGLAQQFEKLKQQISISLTPTAIALCAAPFGSIAEGGSSGASPLWILLGAFLELKVPL
ncbi:MAG: hypothetical protein KME57_20455 [Scytonema hyalinum WJT4-NPBG1]|jgi:hypothetical protein|nr:hypothetical protein [Scytonema hyalinum WJT4-NPBG1]